MTNENKGTTNTNKKKIMKIEETDGEEELWSSNDACSRTLSVSQIE